MKIFITVLVLIFSLQSFSKADDIRDFEIEGISIGDSLFNHITKEQFNDWEEFKHYYKGNKFVVIPCKYPAQQYDQIGCTIKIAEDENHKIVGVHGTIKFPDNLSACLKKKEEVAKEFKEMLKNTIIDDMGTYPHNADPTGNSTQTVIDFNFSNGGYIRVVCHDWSKELAEEGWTDEFKVYITSKELEYFINTEAYN
tara:strand:+ start:838 stop:1428 length:591 start_codon:yes stop_codon:yes gene_type:complete